MAPSRRWHLDVALLLRGLILLVQGEICEIHVILEFVLGLDLLQNVRIIPQVDVSGDR